MFWQWEKAVLNRSIGQLFFFAENYQQLLVIDQGFMILIDRKCFRHAPILDPSVLSKFNTFIDFLKCSLNRKMS